MTRRSLDSIQPAALIERTRAARVVAVREEERKVKGGLIELTNYIRVLPRRRARERRLMSSC